ncbi:MAG: C2H2-type zinc finger protein [Deltaproteobacteria bacterium]
MIKQKKCSICKKIFTRKWNLKRHSQDVHKIYDNTKKDNINPEIGDYNSLPINIDSNNNFRNKNNENNMNGMIYNENSSYDNNFPNTFPNPEYSNDEFYPYSNFNPSLEKEKRLNVDDRIRIQKGLKILESYLEKIYPPGFVFQIISWLRSCCRYEKSDEPLKNFFVQMNLGDRWPF